MFPLVYSSDLSFFCLFSLSVGKGSIKGNLTICNKTLCSSSVEVNFKKKHQTQAESSVCTKSKYECHKDDYETCL